MLGRLDNGGNRLVAVGGLAAPEVDDAVGHEGVAVINVAAGIGGGRMAGNEMKDRKLVFHRAQAPFQCVVFVHAYRPTHGVLWNLQ